MLQRSKSSSNNAWKAYELFQKALDAKERAISLGILKLEESGLGNAFMHLGNAALELDKYDESEMWHRKAIDFKERPSSKVDMPDLSLSYNNYGYCLWQIGKLDQAYSTLQKALAIVQSQKTDLERSSYRSKRV